MTREEQTISNLKKLKSFHNGSYGTDIDRAIKALEQEPCEDAISRQAAIDAIDKWIKAEHVLETLPTDKVTPLFKSVHKLPPVNPQMTDQWNELKETIIEMRDNNGTGTQQEVCRFLANLMDVLEKQMQEPKTGHWIDTNSKRFEFHGVYKCSECGNTEIEYPEGIRRHFRYCPNCGVKMVEPEESGSLCDSCVTKGCIFQSGIVRNHCDFYKAESEEAWKKEHET